MGLLQSCFNKFLSWTRFSGPERVPMCNVPTETLAALNDPYGPYCHRRGTFVSYKKSSEVLVLNNILTVYLNMGQNTNKYYIGRQSKYESSARTYRTKWRFRTADRHSVFLDEEHNYSNQYNRSYCSTDD